MSGAEIFFILFVAVMVFGADKIPEIARGLGKGMQQLKDATEDIKNEIQKSAEKQGIDTSFTNDIRDSIDNVKQSIDTSFTNDVKKGIDVVKKDVDEVAGVVKRK